ncbi:hypothetical protein NQ315_008372 [Exocentrus adspersus]|uniref:Calponin-homology (CH) domain-containing protein n=1 Tax=Exocentrus adspersus TaxID=1586481 RepID=A0AAV8VSF8_9CUCU|nr:hypothetical protein NQ315_008372 [Exocentrus adspersus]
MDFDCDELYKWIDEHSITRQKRNLHRDFSDAVPMAEILKQHFPKLVDLHNYSPKNSFSQKLVNWEILNRKVLSKLKMNLSSSNMEQLAKGAPGAIEKLLHAVKVKVERRGSGDNNQSSSEKVYFLEDASNISSKDGIVPVKIKSGTKTIERKMVPSEVFEEMEKSITDKEETITVLKTKVEHLESLISVKDERIKDLTQQLQTVVNHSTSQPNLSSHRASFFNNIF